MKPPNASVRNELITYVARQEQRRWYGLPTRAPGVVDYLDGHDAQLPALLDAFLAWVRANRREIVCVLIWGSYARSQESDRSFSWHALDPLAERDLILGPSDLDALVVTKKEITGPSRHATYGVIDTNQLVIDRTVELDLFRDVMVIGNEKLAMKAELMKPAHKACVGLAFSETGILAMDELGVREWFLDKYPLEIYGSAGIRALSERLNRFRAVLSK